MMLILSLLDFISNFAYEYIEEISQREELYKNSIKEVEKVKLKNQEFVLEILKNNKTLDIDIGGYHNRKSFISFLCDFFPKEYSDKAEMIWDYCRHGHTHIFLPKKISESLKISIKWAYKLGTNSKSMIGMPNNEIRKISISEIWKQTGHLKILDGWLYIIPQYFYGHFRYIAIPTFKKKLDGIKKQQTIFSNYYKTWRKQF
ncbi:hypothetical protein JW766_04040 [Candidatus Dojkabacteria bacterium]|nr:hypothetical protein [Candidatus Dojkabacteria bacterium]